VIAVDTSALMAVLLDEPQAQACMSALESEDLVISAGTMAEAMIVARMRNVGEEMSTLLAGLGLEVAPVTAIAAQRIAEAYVRWGKGVHAASLNFGDCFAYEVARDRGCPLLYVGEDFSRTDVERVLR
jgi:ribonuclease VapC